MAIIATTSNHFKYMVLTKEIHIVNDDIRAILLNPSFTFNKDTHATLADVNATGFQLPTNYGYTQDTYAVTGKVIIEDDTNDRASWTCDDITWTALGGNIGPFRSMILYDNTTTNKTVVAHILFDVEYTIQAGAYFTAQTLKLSLV